MSEPTTDAIEQQLRSLGSDADAGKIDPEAAPVATSTPTGSGDRAAATDEPGEIDAGKKDDIVSSSETDSAKKEAEAKAVADKAAADKAEADRKAAEEAGNKESKFVKAKKDGERLDKSWKALNEEKEQVRAEKAEFERQRQEAEAAKTQAEQERVQQTATALKDQRGFTAEQYEQAAKDFQASGDQALAQKALEAAGSLRQQEQQAAQQANQKQFMETWTKTVDSMIKEVPDLGKPDAPLAQEVSKLLAEEPLFSAVPDGFKRAVEVAKLRLEAGKVSELQAKVESLTKENERLNKATSLGGSNPRTPSGQKKFADMSSDEQEESLRRQAREADQAA